MNTLKTTIGTVAILLLLTVLPACMDDIPDHSHEATEYENLKALQDSEAGTARREAAAQALCREAHGESVAIWTADGRLVCRARRGPGKAVVQL